MSGIKNALKKILPVRGSVFEHYEKEQRAKFKSLSQQIESLLEQDQQILRKLESLSQKDTALAKISYGIRDEVRSGLEISRTSLDSIREILWAEIFNQTKTGSEWLDSVSLSPGRWAVGYQFLYPLYRVLDEIKPRHILELGLGQSTVVISNYVKSNPGVHHEVIEHDESWIEFFKRKNSLPGNTMIQLSSLAMVDLADCSHKVRVYDRFSQIVENKKFDLVVVDGPFGAGMDECSRIDILSLIPDHLESSFVILFDDFNRAGEQGTVRRLLRLLDEADIAYTHHTYKGEKATLLLCSADLAFLATM